MLRMDKNMDRITQQYRLWLEKADKDHELLQELKSMEDSPQKIQDAFYQIGRASCRERV